MHRIIMVFTLLIVLFSGTVTTPTPTVHAAEQCFTETGYCIDGRIAEFWNKQGGLSVFGFPIGPAETITVDGKLITQQNFERQRIEYHPSNAKPYDILLGRLGADVLAGQGRDWYAFAKSGNQPGCMYFAQTDQSVCGLILERWKATGIELDGRRGLTDAERLALHGLPLSGLVTETLSDGRQYQVQWFERTRIELHPQNQPPYNIQQGLLGRELGTPVPTAQSTQAPVSAPAPSSSAANIPAGSSKATVVRVVDGDTIRVNLNGKEVTIRMIGLDTPETKDPRKPVQCYGQEASNKAVQLLDGATVYLEVDPTQGTYDAYQRLLSYVWMSDGRLFNQLMIDEGYAFEYTYNKPYKYQAAFKNAERTAREQQRGLWSPATCNGTASAVTTNQQQSTGTGASPGGGSSSNSGSGSSTESYPCAINQIKGNVNSGIYHVPGGASYAKTTANVQCFNTEAEAVAAGFRRAKR